MAPRRLVVVLVLAASVAVALGVAVASRGDGKPPKPAQPAHVRGVGDDNATLMRRLQREERERSQKSR